MNPTDKTLHDAIMQDDIEAVAAALEAGADPNATAADGTPFLLWCAQRCYQAEQLKIAKLLLGKGALIDERNDSLIDHGERKRPDEVAERMLDDVASSSSAGEMARNAHLMWNLLVSHRQREALIRNMEENPSVLLRDEAGRTVLHWLAAEGDRERTEEYLLNGVPCIAITDNKGNTPLLVAAAAGQTKTLKQLMQHNPIWMTDHNTAGENALHLAIRSGKVKAVDLVIKESQDTDYPSSLLFRQTDQGIAPLTLAIREDQPQMALAIIEGLIEDDDVDYLESCAGREGPLPIQEAAARGHAAVCRKLIEAGVDSMAGWSHVKNDSGTDQLAVLSGDPQTVEVFLEHDPDLARADREGERPENPFEIAGQMKEKALQAGDEEKAEQFGRIVALIEETYERGQSRSPAAPAAAPEPEAGM